MSSACCPAPNIPTRRCIYTGHWDHLGIGKPDATGDTIYNGALDNATGIAQVIEQARLVRERAAHRPLDRLPRRHRRGKGPAGQRILCQPPALSAGQDGRRAQHRRRPIVGPGEELHHLAATPGSACSTCSSPKGKKQGRYYSPDPHPEAGYFFRSDHFAFAKAGVPAISFSDGNDLRQRRDRARRGAGQGL